MNKYQSLFQLDAKTALITGAASGIGAEIARAYVAMGADVVLTDRDAGLCAPLAAELGEKATVLKLDVAVEEDWQQVAATLAERKNGLQILVNNAGIFHMQPTLEHSLEDFRRVLAVNVEGVFLGCKHMLPLLSQSSSPEDRGSVVNLSSVGGMVGQPCMAAYTSSKGAVRLMTKSLALECAQFGMPVRVNSLHPCIVKTDMGNQVFQAYAAALNLDVETAEQAVNGLHPLGTVAAPEDVATAAIFLASNAARMMTGSELVVDGGLSAQ